MGTSDGSIIRTVKVVDHGPAALRQNIVILGDGYRSTEMATYHNDVQNFIDHLRVTEPFDELWCRINIFRVDVASTDSGADDPAACGDGTTGSGATVATYFDSTFCVNNTRRLLAGDDAIALATSRSEVPQVHATLVIVNTTTYGGAGGGASWFSRAANANEIGIHEMAHTYFGLTDEYADIHDNHSGVEPLAANATVNTNRATIKWQALIQPTTALPTTTNADCTTDGPAASPVPAGTVGAFEGADRARCGAFRPEFDCKMRNLGVPFCAVCQQRIRQEISVPEGDAVDCATVTLRRVSGNRFVSTKVVHAVAMHESRAETASDIFIRSTTNGFLRAELETVLGSLVNNIEVDA